MLKIIGIMFGVLVALAALVVVACCYVAGRATRETARAYEEAMNQMEEDRNPN